MHEFMHHHAEMHGRLAVNSHCVCALHNVTICMQMGAHIMTVIHTMFTKMVKFFEFLAQVRLEKEIALQEARKRYHLGQE
jgi:hypothetical protein